MKKVDVIVDLQYGSTGKGLIAGYLAKAGKYDTVVNANMPNAGHTFIDAGGREWIHKVLPNGIVGQDVKQVMIGPGSVFSLDRLEKEMAMSEDIMTDMKLWIHQDAVVLDESHAAAERKSLNHIASTMQGSMEAMVQRMRRDPKNDPTAKTVLKGTKWEKHLLNQNRWLTTLYCADKILLEGAQGYSLGISAGFHPFCTSRDCTPARFLSDCGIPAQMLNEVIGTARVHPIRVGSTEGGYSGDFYSDQWELEWEDLGLTPEKTTVTQRDRRIFSFSELQITEAIAACRPDKIFLNFCNYDLQAADTIEVFMNYRLEEICGGRVAFLGYGPKENNIKEV